MNLQNRRLREIQKEKQFFKTMLDNSESISDCLTYKGKLDLLSKEEAEILDKEDVKIWALHLQKPLNLLDYVKKV